VKENPWYGWYTSPLVMSEWFRSWPYYMGFGSKTCPCQASQGCKPGTFSLDINRGYNNAEKKWIFSY